MKLKKNTDYQTDIKLESFVCMVSRIMVLQRCPHPNPWSLWICHLTWQQVDGISGCLSADLGMWFSWITHLGPVPTRVIVSGRGWQESQCPNQREFWRCYASCCRGGGRGREPRNAGWRRQGNGLREDRRPASPFPLAQWDPFRLLTPRTVTE